MLIKTSDFLQSNSSLETCPAPNIPEFAFIGRSNVGKSSLINMLLSRKNLAKTSSTPGKTQLINHFIINANWYLVDLPGYGYAKVSKEKRSTFKGMIYNYLEKRPNLECTFVLIDSRLEPQKIDLEFMGWLSTQGIPFVMVFTKTDKLNATQLEKNIAFYRKQMLKEWEELPVQFLTSAEHPKGKDEMLAFIEETFKQALINYN